MSSNYRDYVTGGNYYHLRRDGRLVPVGDCDHPPAVVICRRVADFPYIPEGGAVATCTLCAAAIAYNPAGPHQDRPKVCHRCAGVMPLPWKP